MYCPNCFQRISARAKSCPYCGVPLRRTGGWSGGRMFVILLLCAAAAVLQLEYGGNLKNMAAYVLAPEDAVQSENPPRGNSVQLKEGSLGSAGYLRGDVLLVSLYINDRNTSWNADQEENVRKYLTVACDFLEEEAADYGQELNFVYDVEEYPDLRYRADFSGRAETDMSGQFTRWLYRWIDDNVPVADLQKSYGTDNVGFLALVADEGGAYTQVYYIEDSERYFNEISVLFYYFAYLHTTDREVPAVYAHEILHQFGAIDLYEDSPDFSPENIAYVAETYPDDIMYSDYTEDGRLNYDSINLSISPVTAYYLGWLDELPERDRESLTEYERVCVAGFSYDDVSFGEEGEKK